MRKFAIALLLLAIAAAAHGQAVDNTLYAKGFQGSTVGFKVTAALGACNQSALQCFIVLDPSLKTWPNGTMPTIPGNVHLIDWRDGLPWGTGAGFVSANGDGMQYCIPYWVAAKELGDSPICFDSGTGTTTATIHATGEILLNSPAIFSEGEVVMTAAGNGSSQNTFFDGSTTNHGVSLVESNAGSGYTPGQIGACTVIGGSFTQQATCAVEGGATGAISIAVVNPGVYSVAPTSLGITGLTTGSGFAYTLTIGQAQQDNWAQGHSISSTAGLLPAGSYFGVTAPGRKAAGIPNYFEMVTTPIQGVSSGYLLKLPEPNLTGTVFQTQDLDALTASRVIHWPDQSGTVQLGGIANIQIAMATATIPANQCETVGYHTAAMAGVISTTVFGFSPAGDATAIAGWNASVSGLLYISSKPTTDALNYIECNPTGTAITPAAITVNVSAK
jgi:hypothetical protein